jgi:hypothetical protein
LTLLDIAQASQGRTTMSHYHIRWSDSKIDWQAFPAKDEAVVEAERLKRVEESYIIEEQMVIAKDASG